MKKQRTTEASLDKRGKPDQIVEKKKSTPRNQPKLKQRQGPVTRKTKTDTKKAPGGGVYKKNKPDTTPLQNRAKNQKGPTALEVQIFETVDESKLSVVEARCLIFVREFLQHQSVKKAAVSMGIPQAQAMSVGTRYFRHEFTQKLLRESMLDIARDRKALSRMILSQALAEADPDERYQEMGSHRARVSALELASKLLGLQEKTLNVKGKGSGPVGVMVIPQAKSREEWEAEVTQRQASLKSKASNDKPSDETIKERVRAITKPNSVL